MKTIVTQLTMIGISLIAVSLMFVGQSFAKIDQQSISFALCSSMLFRIIALPSTRQTTTGAWLFDENTGKVAKDISENGNDGNLMGNPKWVNGKFSKALDFNGSTDYVEVANSDSLDITDAITIVAWIYKRSDAVHGGTIVGKWKQVGNTWSYVLYGLGDAGGGFRLMWDDKPTQTNLEGPYQLPNNDWVHYAATYDGSSMKVFENGKEIATINANRKINVSANPVWIGNDGYQQHFNGILDEVAIFNVALTVDEIKSIMEGGLSKTLAVSASGKAALTWENIKVKP